MSTPLITLTEAIQRAAKELPDGYIISVNVERGSGWVTLDPPNGESITPDGGGMTLTEEVLACLERALRP